MFDMHRIVIIILDIGKLIKMRHLTDGLLQYFLMLLIIFPFRFVS